MVSHNLRFRFTLVSYNILSQTLLNEHSFLYTSCNPRDLEWPRRGHRIVQNLLDKQADIICLQEVEMAHLRSLYRPELANYGYGCVFKKKTGYKVDGCAIFYKSTLFRLLNHKGIEFNRTDIANMLDRDNVGIIAVLKPRIKTKSESSHLIIANTHLLFNPVRCDIRLAQLKFFLSELENISRQPSSYYTSKDNHNRATSKSRSSSSSSSTSLSSSSETNESSNKRCHYPTILCGDFNSSPDSAVNRYILNSTNLQDDKTNSAQQLEMRLQQDSDDNGYDNRHQQSNHVTNLNEEAEDNSDTITTDDCPEHNNCDDQASYKDNSDTNNLSDYNHSMKFESVYPSHNPSGQKYVSTFSSEIVDYIFYTPKLRLVSYDELPTEAELADIGPIPNSFQPSDHIKLLAQFMLK